MPASLHPGDWPRCRGCITTLISVINRPADDLERRLGFNSGRLAEGWALLLLKEPVAGGEFEFAGYTVPGGAYVNYSSWVSHRLEHVFPEPHEFRPERFAPERKAALPRGAYVPFGAGSRICIGMRFGQLEIKAIATALLQRFDFELEPGYQLRIRQMPTIGPRHGVPLIVRRRDRAAARPAAQFV